MFDHKNKQDLSESKLLGTLSVTNWYLTHFERVACFREFLRENIGVLAFPVISFLTDATFVPHNT